MTTIDIARICHEANKAYCESIGDHSQNTWDKAEQWQRTSMVKGVEFRIANPDAPEDSQHKAWCETKYLDGWKFGAVKDGQAKTHPCLVDYKDLPREQQLKDKLSAAIIDALKA